MSCPRHSSSPSFSQPSSSSFNNLSASSYSSSSSSPSSPSHTKGSSSTSHHGPTSTIPTSILIVGAGVFGLSTALALTQREAFRNTHITIIDRSTDPAVFPARDASSIDTSRIIRADYADPAYATLAAEAQELWRRSSSPDDLGAEGRYTETGLLLVADEDDNAASKNKTKKSGMDYVRASWTNVQDLYSATHPNGIQSLPSANAIRTVYGTGGGTGTWGYLNRLSGWADAEACMDWLHRQVRATNRVTFVNGTVMALAHDDPQHPQHVTGVVLDSGATHAAALTVLATGAWTPSLINLTGRAVATGQVLAYMDLTPDEQARLAHKPTLLNFSTGHFIITPAHNTLKIARHGYGYLNPTANPTSKDTISSPITHLTHPHLRPALVPAAEEAAMRRALTEMIPWPSLATRPFRETRLCWYTDTPDGDFIIDYHPDAAGTLFVATGGSGHGFKFLPVIGDKITDCILGQCPKAFEGKWNFAKEGALAKAWDQVVTEDGSRGGVPGLRLVEAYSKTTPRL